VLVYGPNYSIFQEVKNRNFHLPPLVHVIKENLMCFFFWGGGGGGGGFVFFFLFFFFLLYAVYVFFFIE